MIRIRLALAASLAAVVALGALQGCTTNPATGGTTFTGGMSAQQEVAIGRKSHPGIVEQFGGEYGSPELKKYVDSIGQFLARTGERRDLKYTFTVLGSDIVNAFAMPGGYIYITRGLLALADDEAQLAAVLAHELGHITGLHHAQRHGQGVLAGVLMTGVGILGGGAGRGLMQAGQGGIAAVLQGFSRENEFEADDLGLRYMTRAGYLPDAMAGFLRKLRAHSRLQARLRGESPDKIDQFNYLATHPAPKERVNRAARRAAATKVRKPITGADVYLSKIDGILYGDDPKNGFIKGRVFAHPVMDFRFQVPEGFRLTNSPKAVTAAGPGGALIVFDRAGRPGGGSMRDYLTRVWARGTRLGQVQTINVNGLDAATGTTRVKSRRGPVDVRLLAMRASPRIVYRLLFITPPNMTGRLSQGLRETTYSFRRLRAGERRGLRGNKISVIRVRRGDTVEHLARRMPFSDFKAERFRTLNGMAARDRLRSGSRVKIIVPDRS